MGSSSSKDIELSLKLDINFQNLKQSLKSESGDVAPAANFNPIKFQAEAKGSDGKIILTKINFNYISTTDNEFTKPNKIEESNAKEINDEESKQKNININESNKFSIFKSNNLKEIDINNKNNDDKINAKNDKSFNNNINNSDLNKKNILKEGIQSQTKFGDEDEQENNNNNFPQTPQGENIDINLARNPYQNSINKSTPSEENKDNNIGFAFQNDEKEDKYIGFNSSNKDLELSQSIYLKDDLEKSMQLVDEGYVAILMKLNDYKPLYLFAKEESNLKSLVKVYNQNCPETDKGMENDLKLYEGKRPLDINKPIKYLNLRQPLCVVTNRMVEYY
jgi:hypothetical protein